jgi:hypothetical protein
MQYLLQYAQREDVRAVIEQATTYERVQGVVLDFESGWHQSLNIARRYGYDYERMWRYFARYGGGGCLG